jgi:hypothetical protein
MPVSWSSVTIPMAPLIVESFPQRNATPLTVDLYARHLDLEPEQIRSV